MAPAARAGRGRLVARAAVAVACPCSDLSFFNTCLALVCDARGAAASAAGVLNYSFLRCVFSCAGKGRCAVERRALQIRWVRTLHCSSSMKYICTIG